MLEPSDRGDIASETAGESGVGVRIGWRRVKAGAPVEVECWGLVWLHWIFGMRVC